VLCALLVLAGLPSFRAPVAAEAKAPSLFPRFDNAVPVLLYHRLHVGDSAYSLLPASFDAQMQRLHELGFTAVPLDRYVRFMLGDAGALPRRPILITFDDAYVSSWQNADPVLLRYGWSAAMYVPTGAVGRPGHLTWAELRQMQASGRWQIDEHAGDGHVTIPVNAAGRRLPFYASEAWTSVGQETFAHYKRRVRSDIDRGSALLAEHLRGWRPPGTFAVPFNSYGQHGSNDHRIAQWLSSYLRTRFVVAFVQGDDSFTTPRRGFGNRISVSPRWDADTLEAHLIAGLERVKPPVAPT
jgi:peptidoglycan/xylan/chitin deacetylase (PgdA/CDA1 family)